MRLARGTGTGCLILVVAMIIGAVGGHVFARLYFWYESRMISEHGPESPSPAVAHGRAIVQFGFLYYSPVLGALFAALLVIAGYLCKRAVAFFRMARGMKWWEL
jgi:hypothetical protein